MSSCDPIKFIDFIYFDITVILLSIDENNSEV